MPLTHQQLAALNAAADGLTEAIGSLVADNVAPTVSLEVSPPLNKNAMLYAYFDSIAVAREYIGPT